MNIIESLDSFYPRFDGPVQVVHNYCKAFNKMDGVTAQAIVPAFPKFKDQEQAYKIFRVKSMKGPEGDRCPLPKFDRKLKKYLKNQKIDIIHIHSPFTMCGFFAKYGKKHNIPTVFSFHTKFKEDYERLLPKFMVNIAMKYMMLNINKVDHVITVSEGAAETLREYGYRKDIKVIRNGTDMVYPENADALIEEISDKYNLKDDEVVFLSVGRIVVNKKLDFALDVMKKLKDEGLKFKYLIVGSGNYEDALKEKAKKLGLICETQDNEKDNSVIFTGKIMDRNALAAVYLRADLFVFPSTFDTASLSPIEAAGLKLPTIMTRGCSTAEIITENVDGLLAEETVDAWAYTILTAVKNKKLKGLSEMAYKQVYRTWDDVAKEMREYYQSLISQKKVD